MLSARRLEKLADTGASACLGGATAFAAYASLAPILPSSVTATCAAATAGFAYWLSRRMLSAITPPLTELWLEDAFVPEAPAPADDSRVVRLFDPAAMPPESMAAGSRLANEMPPPASPDASEALRDALNQLRRSLRQA